MRGVRERGRRGVVVAWSQQRGGVRGEERKAWEKGGEGVKEGKSVGEKGLGSDGGRGVEGVRECEEGKVGEK